MTKEYVKEEHCKEGDCRGKLYYLDREPSEPEGIRRDVVLAKLYSN